MIYLYTLPETGFIWEYDRLVVLCNSVAEESAEFEMELRVGSVLVTGGTFRLHGGRLELTGLAGPLTDAFDLELGRLAAAGHAGRFLSLVYTVTVSGTVSEHTMHLCRIPLEQDFAAFTSSRFLTAAVKEKRVWPDSPEYVSLYVGEADTGGKLTAVLLLASGRDVYTREVDVRPLGSAGVLTTPVRFSRYVLHGETLIGATLRAGRRELRYVFASRRPSCVLEFRNSWGCPEVMPFFAPGEEETAMEYSRSAYDGVYHPLDAGEEYAVTLRTGFLTADMQRLFTDACRSRSLRLGGREVVALEGENRRGLWDEALPSGTLRVRYASRQSVLGGQAPARVFDETFDETFE